MTSLFWRRSQDTCLVDLIGKEETYETARDDACRYAPKGHVRLASCRRRSDGCAGGWEDRVRIDSRRERHHSRVLQERRKPSRDRHILAEKQRLQERRDSARLGQHRSPWTAG